MRRLPIFRAFGQSGLRAVALRGAAWATVGLVLQYAIRLASTLVLTRLLAPEMFGLMALASVPLAALNLLSDIGLSPSVVRSTRGEDPVFLRTTWTLQVVRGISIALVACLVAQPLALFYGEPLLFPLICLLSVTSVVNGFGSISVALCKRRVDIRRLAMLELSAQVVTTLATIAAAWAMQSVWALAVGGIAGSVAKVILSYAILPASPRGFAWEREALREISGFGRWIMLGTILGFLGGRGSLAVMGAMVPVETLGFITIATTISWAARDLAARLLGQVAFPLLSTVARERPKDLVAALRRVKHALALAATPGFILLAAFGTGIIDLLYDDRYAPAGVFLSVAALNPAIGILSMPYQNAMLALGDSRRHAIVMGVDAICRVLGMIAGFHIGGAVGMLVGLGAANLVTFGVSAYFARRRGFATLGLDAALITVLLLAYVAILTGVSGPG